MILKKRKPTEERIIPLRPKVIGKIDNIPEGSKFEKYLEKVRKLAKEDSDDKKLEEYLKQIFRDSVNFLKKSNIKISTNKIFLIFKTKKYLELEKQYTTKPVSEEIIKGPSTAFIVKSNFCDIMYINVGFLLETLSEEYCSFVLNLVNVYFHELLHSAFPDKAEQIIFNLECELLEKFLEIDLPKDFTNIKA